MMEYWNSRREKKEKNRYCNFPFFHFSKPHHSIVPSSSRVGWQGHSNCERSELCSNIVPWGISVKKLAGIREYIRARLTFFIFLGLLVILTFVRIKCSQLIPMSGDEAYYYLWSKYPSFGYYDHPPVISWIIGLFSFVGGNTVLMVRAGSIVAAFIYSIVLFFFAREITDSTKIAFIAGLFLLTIPYFAVDSTMSTPNVPLLLFWMLYLYSLYRAFSINSRGYWILSGILLGFALLSKFMAIFLVVSLFSFLLLSEKFRHNLKRLDPYLSLMIALIIFSPFLIWNHCNNWESFSFQLVARHRFPLHLDLSLFKNFLCMQALAVTPLFFILYIASLLYTLYRGIWGKSEVHLFCFCTTFPIFLFFFVVSFFERVEMYWSIAGYLSGSVCVVLLLEEFKKIKKYSFKIAVNTFLILTSFLLVFSTGGLYYFALRPEKLVDMSARTYIWGEENFRGNGLVEMYAYQDLAIYLVDMQKRLGGKERVFIMTDNYSLSSALTYYANEYIHIYSPWNIQGREYHKWEHYMSLKGMDAIYVDRFPIKERKNMLRLFSQNFDKIELLEPIVMKKYDRVVQTFYVAFLRNFKGTINYDEASSQTDRQYIRSRSRYLALWFLVPGPRGVAPLIRMLPLKFPLLLSH